MRKGSWKAVRTGTDEAPPESIEVAARTVRHVLLRTYPEHRKLEGQCKRAGITLRAVLQKEGIDVQLISGTVRGDRRESGGDIDHIWCRVRNPRNGFWYLLDIALTQFQDLFDNPVPEIVWGVYRSTVRRFRYVEDDPPEWAYDPRDIDHQRVETVRNLLR